jgi:hypothetical protein
MPYLPTSQAYLEQSAQLLEAYPDTVSNLTRIPPLEYPPPTPHTGQQQHPPAPAQHNRRNIKQTNKLQTRIVTKYNFPTTRPGNQKRIQKSQAKTTKAADASTVPIASLTLKTFNPTTGICLHYRTNKAQEVSRLITSLGKLAAGADVAGLGLSAGGTVGGDVELVDAPAPATEEVIGAGKGQQQQGQVQGGKKKKGGKGKR